MTAEPSIVARKLEPEDMFLIFASDGLWEHLSDEAAVEIVLKNSRVVRPCTILLYFTYCTVFFLLFSFSCSTCTYPVVLIINAEFKSRLKLIDNRE